MQNSYRLDYEDLKIDFNYLPRFGDTSEIKGSKDIIGQKRAVEAIDFGLSVEEKGYNIFMLGSMGTGKRSYILEKLNSYTSMDKVLKDWCYVCDFNNPYKPKALWFKSGDASDFSESIENLIEILSIESPKAFSDSIYEKERNLIVDRQKKLISKLINKLQGIAEKHNFKLKNTSEGFAFVPMKEDKEMTEDEYDNLDEGKKEVLTAKVSELKILALDVIKKTKEYKKNIVEDLTKLDEKVTLSIIGDPIDNMRKKYGYNNGILEYIDSLKKDIIKYIDVFIFDEEEREKAEIEADFFNRYKVNILVSSNSGKAPVVYEEQPDYSSLIGSIEYENKQGNLFTDFTMIKPGSLHKANGGYIVIEVEELLKGQNGWGALKNALKTEKISMGGLKHQEGSLYLSNIEPDDIPLDVKVILLGPADLYYLLYNNDEFFKEAFKIKAEFEDEFKNTVENTLKILSFIANYCEENKLHPITKDGVKEILKYSCRESENRTFYTARMDKIVGLIQEANVYSKRNNSSKIDKAIISNTIKSIEKRFDMYRDKNIEKYTDGVYVSDLKGYKVGEINGLSVIDTSDFRFGRQSKITVATFASRTGIINIEREVSMSGTIHSKGVLILSGYFNETFGKKEPISFGASICFEQLYGGVDGDSASLAELIALISSLSETPIDQGIAVTGSINQKGVVQPVGGLNEKIEGFFELCKNFSLTGSQGVILPRRNANNLILNDEVMDAIKEGKFHIYPIDTVEEAFNIITSKDLTRKTKGKVYSSIKEKVKEKLDFYSKIIDEK